MSNPVDIRPTTDIEFRFWEKVAYVGVDWTQCLEWRAARNPSRHGRFNITHRKQVPAHVWAYEQLAGPIPEDRPHLDHWWCENPPCVNPWHVRPTTLTENLYRSGKAPAMVNRAKTHCPQGHPYDEENTHINKRGSRVCRTCLKERMQAAYAADPEKYRRRTAEYRAKKRRES
jgi:hypothetical protein